MHHEAWGKKRALDWNGWTNEKVRCAVYGKSMTTSYVQRAANDAIVLAQSSSYLQTGKKLLGRLSGWLSYVPLAWQKMSVEFQRSMNSKSNHDLSGAGANEIHEGISHNMVTWRPTCGSNAGCHGTRAHLPFAIISGVLARVLEPLRNTRGTNQKKKKRARRNACGCSS